MDLPMLFSASALLGMLAGPLVPVAGGTVGILLVGCAVAWTWTRRPLLLALPIVAAGMWYAHARARTLVSAAPLPLHGVVAQVLQDSSRSRITLETETGVRVQVSTRTPVHLELGAVHAFSGVRYLPRSRPERWALAVQGLDARATNAVPGPALGHVALDPLTLFHQCVDAALARMHPGDRGALLAGLLTGSRGALSARAADALRSSGLAHIVAISGANFALIIALLASALRPLPPRMRSACTALATCAFWAFVGGGSAIARAALTALLGLGAMLGGRSLGALRGLLYSTLILSVLEPLRPFADVGLQLSVLATLGILRATGSDAGILGWREAFRASVWTTLATLPVQFATFGTLPIVAPLANVFALPLVPVAMACGVLELLLGWVPGIGFVLHQCTALCTTGILLVAQTASQLPGAALTLPTLPDWARTPLLAGGVGLFTWLALRRPGV